MFTPVTLKQFFTRIRPAATIRSERNLKECVLIDRYHSAGITSIAHDFYTGGRHEMLHELNRREVITNLLLWLSGIVGQADNHG